MPRTSVISELRLSGQRKVNQFETKYPRTRPETGQELAKGIAANFGLGALVRTEASMGGREEYRFQSGTVRMQAGRVDSVVLSSGSDPIILSGELAQLIAELGLGKANLEAGFQGGMESMAFELVNAKGVSSYVSAPRDHVNGGARWEEASLEGFDMNVARLALWGRLGTFVGKTETPKFIEYRFEDGRKRATVRTAIDKDGNIEPPLLNDFTRGTVGPGTRFLCLPGARLDELVDVLDEQLRRAGLPASFKKADVRAEFLSMNGIKEPKAFEKGLADKSVWVDFPTVEELTLTGFVPASAQARSAESSFEGN